MWGLSQARSRHKICGLKYKYVVALFTWTEIEVLFKNVDAACFGNGLNTNLINSIIPKFNSNSKYNVLSILLQLEIIDKGIMVQKIV